ncbi:MAG: type II secretion system protein [Opitutus sp.]
MTADLIKGHDDLGTGRSAGFTVIELLTVVAIVGVLLAILIPSMSSARVAAKKAETRVRFNQWVMAIQSFRAEYGFYPVFDASNTVNGGADATDHLFHDVLAGRKRGGSSLTAGSAAAIQNKRLISFHAFTESELVERNSSPPDLLCDAFGSTDIAVLIDRNLDGIINLAEIPDGLPEVNGVRPGVVDFPSTGIRASVAFYSLAPGSSAEVPHFICSWK